MGEHPGLLVGYAELCLRADPFEYPGRAARAVDLSRRLKEVAPHSAEAQRLAAAERWARRGYGDDLRTRAAATALEGRATRDQARALAEDLKHAGGATVRDAGTVDRAATVRAATPSKAAGRRDRRRGTRAATGTEGGVETHPRAQPSLLSRGRTLGLRRPDSDP